MKKLSALQTAATLEAYCKDLKLFWFPIYFLKYLGKNTRKKKKEELQEVANSALKELKSGSIPELQKIKDGTFTCSPFFLGRIR